ncbi:MAG: SUMF1/EgtB/PvdO family nonheme iron enzyme [Cellvibrionaceae bacterium]
MNKAQAQQLLGIDDLSPQSVEAAFAQKTQKIQGLLEKAPSDALKTKYQNMLVQLDDAQSLLLAASDKRSITVPPLSQSKFEDLPFAKPRHSQFEEKAQAELHIQEGQVLAGRYKIEEKIAAGGMGVVYRAHDQNRNEDIAIKVMLPSLVKNQRARDKFMDEARLSSKLSHPNIVNVYDVQNEGDLYFITMELLEGQDLRDVMENRKATRQPFTKDEVLELLEQLTEGLNHAHQSTVHRDLKPENIFLTEDGDYKVMDFGIARVQSTSQRTQSGTVSGTAYYMAPEQVKGAKAIDARADQYAIAVFTYELLAGEVPTGMITPLHEIRPDVGKGFSRALERALANKPEDRYDTLDDFFFALEKGKAGGAGLNLNINRGALAMAAMLIVGLLLMGGIWQSGLIDTDKLFISKEEIAQKKAVSAKLAGEIKTLQKRLATGKRTLDSDVRDAQRNSSVDLAALEYWQRTTEDAIFEGSTLVELEGQLAMAQTLLRDESFEQAQQHFTTVKAGYKTLYNNFQAGEQLHALQQNAEAEYNAWAKLKRNYGVSNLTAERKAQDLENRAKQQERTGELAQATNSWKDTIEAWQAAQNSVGDDVAAIQADRRAKDKARKAEAERKRLAAIEAEKKRKAKAKGALIRRLAGEFVSIPGGSFMMGSNDGNSDEKPVHRVNIRPFTMGKYEVTKGQFEAFVNDTGYRTDAEKNTAGKDGCYAYKGGADFGWTAGTSWRNPGYSQKGSDPVVCISHNDTQAYIQWLNKQTGNHYRLPTEAEWEYAARAGSSSKYSFGNSESQLCENGNGVDQSLKAQIPEWKWTVSSCRDGYTFTAPVGSFAPNAFGLYDMHGNVWEWVQDCYHDSYSGAPSDGSAWESGSCAKRVLRGGSWYSGPNTLRSACRGGGHAGNRYNTDGFRLVQD